MFVVNDVGRGCAIPLCGTGWGRMERVRGAGGRAVQTTVEQTLMRGLVTAFPCVRPGLPRSPMVGGRGRVGHSLLSGDLRAHRDTGLAQSRMPVGADEDLPNGAEAVRDHAAERGST